ncbi:MAG: hypothetical protein ACSHX6_09660 [Akkermansiaceae bacterium]
MKFLAKSLLCILASSSSIIADDHDFINFSNDDTLHGQFLGFTTSGKIIWKNDAADKNIAFETKDVRKVVMNNGQRTKPFSHTSYITLKNLDTIPGNVHSLTGDQLTLETDYGGKITIPKDQILDLNINPLGQKVIYRGPFSEEEPWELKYPANRIAKDLSEEEQEKIRPWKFKNFSLNHQGEASSTLMEKEFPDQYRITFNSYSSQSYYPTMTIMADLKVPKYDDEDQELVKNRTRYRSSLGNYLGSSIVIRLHPSNSSLTQYGFKEDGSIFQSNAANMVRGTSSRGTQSKTYYDLRVDKKAGLIMLFANKRNVGQWQIDSLSEDYQGSYFGYNMQYSNSTAQSVISDIVVTTWNGVRDSALSLENETRDIVMLNNGTDRYSGNITGITEQTIDLKTAYAELAIPKDQVSSVTLSRKKTEDPEGRDKGEVAVRFYGTGRITGVLSKAEDGSIFLESKILGKIKIESEFITSFEFVNMDHAYETFQ